MIMIMIIIVITFLLVKGMAAVLQSEVRSKTLKTKTKVLVSWVVVSSILTCPKTFACACVQAIHVVIETRLC